MSASAWRSVPGTRSPLLLVAAGIGLGLLLGALAAFGLRGSLPGLLLALWGATMAVPLLALALVLVGWNLVAVPVARRRATAWSAAAVFALVATFGLLALSGHAGSLVNERDVERAMEYCESLVPALETHRSGTGEYPRELEELGVTAADVPAYLRDQGRFYALGRDGGYRFRVDKAVLLGGYEYSSRTGAWTFEDY